MDRDQEWPALPIGQWQQTCDTLHMWSQVIGKVRLALAPPVNHWWHVPFYVTPRGLTTSAIPWRGETFAVDFDFLDHALIVTKSDGRSAALALHPMPVKTFYKETLAALAGAGIDVKIWPKPVEIADPIRFDEDETHAAYDAEWAQRFWRVLMSVDGVMKEFRSSFLGKCSPVHFFWGSFDLAVTRFSGRRAPEREGADRITREAYSHEVSSCGFWPGGGGQDAAFYAYHAPEPAGYKTAKVRPAGASYSPDLSEFLFKYEDARAAASPRDAILAFFESTYACGARLAGWDRGALEWPAAPTQPGGAPTS